MAFSSEQEIRSRYQRQIDRNRKFVSDLAENLLFYQKGFYSPRELLKTLKSDFGTAEAYAITPRIDNEFPLENCLVVRRTVTKKDPAEIQIHDPFADLTAHQYTAIVLDADSNKFFPSKIFQYDNHKIGPVRELNQKTNEDFGEGEAIISFFEISNILE